MPKTLAKQIEPTKYSSDTLARTRLRDFDVIVWSTRNRDLLNGLYWPLGAYCAMFWGHGAIGQGQDGTDGGDTGTSTSRFVAARR
jgi:hypothetical protein